jgi:hypothetical protein
MSTRRFAAAVTLLVCLAGCAGNASSSSSSSASSPAPSASSVAPPSGDVQTVTGTVEAGVEPNCRIIHDDSGSHLLVFHDAALRDGAVVGKKITVTGSPDPKLMSTCQQGIPFVVTSISPA